jgi:hypothetical protein
LTRCRGAFPEPYQRLRLDPGIQPYQFLESINVAFSEPNDSAKQQSQAKRIITTPSAAEGASLDTLHIIRDTCQRYALGKAVNDKNRYRRQDAARA